MDIVMCSIDRNLVIHLVKVEAQNPIVAESETHPQSPSFFSCAFRPRVATFVHSAPTPPFWLLSRILGRDCCQGGAEVEGAQDEKTVYGVRSLGQMDRRSIGF